MFLYKNNKILLTGLREDLESLIEELKQLNPSTFDRRLFEIRNCEGIVIKKWGRR